MMQNTARIDSPNLVGGFIILSGLKVIAFSPRTSSLPPKGGEGDEQAESRSKEEAGPTAVSMEGESYTSRKA
jgi:hypothetical protein